MHSASSRFNSITLCAGLLMAALCAINYFQGRLMCNPTAEVNFEIVSLPQFIATNGGQVASFRYNMNASNSKIIEDLSSLYQWNLKQLFAYI